MCLAIINSLIWEVLKQFQRVSGTSKNSYTVEAPSVLPLEKFCFCTTSLLKGAHYFIWPSADTFITGPSCETAAVAVFWFCYVSVNTAKDTALLNSELESSGQHVAITTEILECCLPSACLSIYVSRGVAQNPNWSFLPPKTHILSIIIT